MTSLVVETFAFIDSILVFVVVVIDWHKLFLLFTRCCCSLCVNEGSLANHHFGVDNKSILRCFDETVREAEKEAERERVRERE